MRDNIEKLGYKWIIAKVKDIDIQSDGYCQTRDIFQGRLDKMITKFIISQKFNEDDIYLAAAVAGEIGNNSFDHNLGNWPDAAGIFFIYTIHDGKMKIILADRGRGILKTLKRVKPELTDDAGALKVAFSEKISGRAPEKRGNGLKFVREAVKERKMRLIFISGNARAALNNKMEIKKNPENVKGCFASLTLNL